MTRHKLLIRHKLTERLQAYAQLTRIDKPVGSLLLLWPALWGILLAGPGLPSLNNCIIFILGTFLMRSAGCAINDYADRKIDGAVERTQQRPLAQGVIKPWEALLVAAVLSLCAFLLALNTHRLVVYLSPLALILVVVYPFTKRWLACPQLVLGAAFAFAIPMGFAAELGRIPLLAWGYFGLTLLWVAGYDTFYAMADRPDDITIGVRSSAILLGSYAEILATLSTSVFAIGFVCLAYQPGMLWLWLALLIALVPIIYQQYQLAQTQVLSSCILAFKLSNLIGLLVTCIVFVTQAWFYF